MRAWFEWPEILIGLALLFGAGAWGTVYWNRTFTAGQRPSFYQHYFEPAVMIACGRGFAAADPQVPAMGAFLRREADRFTCDQIPAGVTLRRSGLYQQPWWYLMYTVGVAWRMLGISWSGMGPVFGLLFAATVVVAYAIFRLGMNRVLALVCSVGFMVSPLHLLNLPRLRDYSKAPFTLMLIFLLGFLVTRRAARGTVLAIAAAYGIVLGVGYGFRTDFLADVPPFFLTLWAFLEGGVFRNLRLKVAATVLCLATFVVSGWPIVSAVYRAGGCQWHVALLGFSAHFSGPLGVDQPPYQLSRVYLDKFVETTVTSYALRMTPDIGQIEFCQSEYDVQSRRYLREVASHFPADMVVRAYASARRIVELPFTGRPDIRTGEREHAENQAPGKPGASGPGLALVIAAVGLAMGANPRVGLFLVFFLLYFGGYPAIQFDVRHYFHLEFVTWWAAGFVLQSAILGWRRVTGEWRWAPKGPVSVRRAVWGLVGSAVVLTLGLWTCRAYQQSVVRSMLARYLTADGDDIVERPVLLAGVTFPITRVAPATDPETAEMVRIDVNEWQCGEQGALTFRYSDVRHPEFLRTVALKDRGGRREATRIFMPVYDGFQGIELTDAIPGCIARVSRLRHPEQFSLLLEAVLPPGWERARLHQRLSEVRLPESDAAP